jgi:tetratricopeptide (TPR) repeat protein
MLAAYTKLAALAPADWRVLVALGWDANETGDPAKAIDWFTKALAVKPDLAFAQDGLAYGHAGLRAWDAAIAASKKQVELLPKQPNPQDTLGEILLMAGKFDDAEKAFQAALGLEPRYNIAWQGIALARAYRGDWKGAYEANEKQNAGTVDTYDSVGVIIDGAWLVYAASELAPALARLDVIDADAEAKKTPAFAFAALARATLLQLEDKYADAAKWFETGRARGEALPGSSKRLVARDHAIGLLRNGALSGKPDAGADKLLATLDQDATATGDPTSKSYAAWGHGLAAWAKTGAKEAIAELAKCRPQLLACRFDLATAQRKAGDTTGADATEQQIRESPQREASAVFYVTELAPKKP